MVYELKQPEIAAKLFEGWQETLIWSCLQGVMGKICADSWKDPVSAMALLGDFCFFAGRPDRELVLYGSGKPEEELIRNTGVMIMIPQDEEWAGLIRECYGEKARRAVRYAIKKEPDVFDREKLQAAVDGLPKGYVLRMIDEGLFWQCREMEWCRDWVAQYDDYALFQKFGLGVVIMKDGQPVSGASSYSGYIGSQTGTHLLQKAVSGRTAGGIEVEIDTREDYRRRGLAFVCGAKLILECLDRGWYPSWDAQNLWSAALAGKLGYHMDHEYVVYEVARETF